MTESRFIKFGFDLRAVAAILVASLAVGVVNNMLTGEERRVPWSGNGIAHDGAAEPAVREADDKADDGEGADEEEPGEDEPDSEEDE